MNERKEITAVILLDKSHWFNGPRRKLEKSFSDCVEAWNWIEDITRKASKRRSKDDREQCRYAYYYGETIGGNKYGGVYMVNNARVNPDNTDYCRQLCPVPFDAIDYWCPDFVTACRVDRAKRKAS